MDDEILNLNVDLLQARESRKQAARVKAEMELRAQIVSRMPEVTTPDDIEREFTRIVGIVDGKGIRCTLFGPRCRDLGCFFSHQCDTRW